MGEELHDRRAQRPDYPVEAYAGQPDLGLGGRGGILRRQHHGLVGSDHIARVVGESSLEADVDRAPQGTEGELGRLRQLEVPGEEVGMEVGFDDPLDAQSVSVSVGKVAADVVLGVYDDACAAGFITDQVGRMGQAFDVVRPTEYI